MWKGHELFITSLPKLVKYIPTTMLCFLGPTLVAILLGTLICMARVDMVVDCARKTGCIVTAENHNIYGGLGSAVAEALAENAPAPLVRVGALDRCGEVGDLDYLMRAIKLTAEDIAAACRLAIRKKA